MAKTVTGTCTECGSPIFTAVTRSGERIMSRAEPERTCPPECRFSPEAYQLFTYRNGEIHAGKTVRSRQDAIQTVKRAAFDHDTVPVHGEDESLELPTVEEFQFYLPVDATEEDHA